MNEVIASILWTAVGVIGVALIIHRVPPRDRDCVWICFWGHIVSSFVLLWLTYNYFGRGDVQMYYHYGELLGEYIVDDPGRWGPEVVRLIFQYPVELPVNIYGHIGSSTTSITGMTCLVMLVSGGSEYGTAIAFSLLAFSGQFGIYVAFRRHFPLHYRRRLLVAILLVPSAVFWTSGVVKEAVAIAGMGWIIWGLHCWIVRKKRLPSLFWVGTGGVLVAISKSYVLFPLTVAAGVWWFWRHSMSTSGSVAIASKPFYLLGGCAVAVFGMIGLGELFPQYSFGQLAEETANLQYQGQRVGGGSNYVMGDPTQTSLLGQLGFAPVAIVTSLFRPFIFEAHNVVAVINGLETTAIAVLWVRILWLRGVRGTWRVLRSSPVLMFCVVFILLFSLGVGLGTTNLGTLSRYRVPMMPLYALTLLMLLPKQSRK